MVVDDAKRGDVRSSARATRAAQCGGGESRGEAVEARPDARPLVLRKPMLDAGASRAVVLDRYCGRHPGQPAAVVKRDHLRIVGERAATHPCERQRVEREPIDEQRRLDGRVRSWRESPSAPFGRLGNAVDIVQADESLAAVSVGRFDDEAVIVVACEISVEPRALLVERAGAAVEELPAGRAQVEQVRRVRCDDGPQAKGVARDVDVMLQGVGAALP